MSPQLFSRQMKDGAWAITIASVQQLQVARHYGFDRIAAATRAAKLKRSLQLIVEGAFLGGRTGCRQLDHAMAVARTVKANEPYLSLRGVGGYEGLLRGKTPAEVGRLVTDFLGYLIEIAVTCDREDCFAAGTVLLTGGGSTFYDLVTRQFARAGVQRRFIALTRSGCCLTHDFGAYLDSFAELRKRTPEVDELGPGSAAALEIWSYVQSRPESEKAILAVGKRDISNDSRLPQPLKWFRPSAAANARDIKPSGRTIPSPASTISIVTLKCRRTARSLLATWWRSASPTLAPHSTNGRSSVPSRMTMTSCRPFELSFDPSHIGYLL